MYDDDVVMAAKRPCTAHPLRFHLNLLVQGGISGRPRDGLALNLPQSHLIGSNPLGSSNKARSAPARQQPSVEDLSTWSPTGHCHVAATQSYGSGDLIIGGCQPLGLAIH